MVIMALDHTRDFFHRGGHDPTDLTQASAALFLTRLITHLCAPTFVFLAGASAFLSATASGVGRPIQSRDLLLRGLWLVLLELTLIGWGWSFDFDYEFVGVQVFWALGWSMVALAALIWLPRWGVLAVGGAMVLGHNLTDGWRATGSPFPTWLWSILHVEGMIDFGWVKLYVLYPLIPWIGVMALGYLFGSWMVSPTEVRRRRCLGLGIACLTAFALLRATNWYGDSRLWDAPAGRSALYGVLGFFNTSKYPPSLLYLLMTLGTTFLLLAAFERWSSNSSERPSDAKRRSPVEVVRHALLVFGRVPLFFYLLHIYLIHGMAELNRFLRLGPRPANVESWEWGARAGYDLPGVYAAWLVVVLTLYPLCARYDAYKRARRGGWTRYL